MQQYDFIMAGGGVAGLSLAYHLAQSPLGHRSILIIDRDAKDHNDRTLAFWSDQPTCFDSIISRSWDRVRVASEDFESTFALDHYRYNVIRGIDFYRFVHRDLSARPNVTFVQGEIARIEDGQDGAVVIVNGQQYAGRWVFDSRFDPRAFQPAHTSTLKQHFKGWVIETGTPAFDPDAPTLMDFRTPQRGEARFAYVLPFSDRCALVEYVLLSPAHATSALQSYIEQVLGIKDYRIVSREGGVSPLTDYPFPRQQGQHILTIGTPGGRVKPSSGYAFMRIQADSAAIVRSLGRFGHPFALPADSRYFKFCDSLMLRVMRSRCDWLKPLLVTLFRRNPIERVFRFLDEASSPAQNLLLMASLVPQLIVRFAFEANRLMRSTLRPSTPGTHEL